MYLLSIYYGVGVIIFNIGTETVIEVSAGEAFCLTCTNALENVIPHPEIYERKMPFPAEVQTRFTDITIVFDIIENYQDKINLPCGSMASKE